MECNSSASISTADSTLDSTVNDTVLVTRIINYMQEHLPTWSWVSAKPDNAYIFPLGRTRRAAPFTVDERETRPRYTQARNKLPVCIRQAGRSIQGQTRSTTWRHGSKCRIREHFRDTESRTRLQTEAVAFPGLCAFNACVWKRAWHLFSFRVFFSRDTQCNCKTHFYLCFLSMLNENETSLCCTVPLLKNYSSVVCAVNQFSSGRT